MLNSCPHSGYKYRKTERRTKSEKPPIKSKIAAILAAFLITADIGLASYPSDRLESYTRKQWTSHNGLPQNSIQSICQTRDGYLWLGTENGLARFNGAEFLCFSNENTPSFKSNDVQVIHEDSSGVLWIGTASGLIRYRDGIFTEVPDIPGSPDLVVSDISQDRGGNLWLATDKGLVRYRNGSFERLTKSDGLSYEHIFRLMIDSSGNLWAGTVNGWLFSFGADSLKEPFLKDMKYASRKLPFEIADICDAGAGNIFGVGGEYVFLATHGDLANIKKVSVFPGKRLLAMIRDSEGNFIIGPSNGGLIRIKDRPPYEPEIDPRFSEDYVRCLYCDRSGDLWLGSRGSGLFGLSNTIIKMFTRNEGLSNDFIRSVYVDPEGEL